MAGQLPAYNPYEKKPQGTSGGVMAKQPGLNPAKPGQDWQDTQGLLAAARKGGADLDESHRELMSRANKGDVYAGQALGFVGALYSDERERIRKNNVINPPDKATQPPVQRQAMTPARGGGPMSDALRSHNQYAAPTNAKLDAITAKANQRVAAMQEDQKKRSMYGKDGGAEGVNPMGVNAGYTPKQKPPTPRPDIVQLLKDKKSGEYFKTRQASDRLKEMAVNGDVAAQEAIRNAGGSTQKYYNVDGLDQASKNQYQKLTSENRHERAEASKILHARANAGDKKVQNLLRNHGYKNSNWDRTDDPAGGANLAPQASAHSARLAAAEQRLRSRVTL
jgi:hypothetical protein